MKCSVFKVVFSILIFSAVSYLYSDTIHEVQKGETLYSISKKYGVSVADVQSANGLSDNGIKVGQKIKIPDGKTSEAAPSVSVKTSAATTSAPVAAKPTSNPASTTKAATSSDESYIVQKGETWFDISKKYGITVADLQKLNGVGSDAALIVGQKIKVPGEKSGAKNAVSTAKNVTETGKKAEEVKKTESKVPDLENPRSYSGKKADSSLVWPVKTENIVYINGKVGGVSMAAKKDEEVKAIRAGTVMFSGSYRGFGNVVFIQSKTGHIYAYTGLGSIDVSKGDYINYSSEIGTAGIDTYTGKSQISLMVFQNGQPIDPAKAPRG